MTRLESLTYFGCGCEAAQLDLGLLSVDAALRLIDRTVPTVPETERVPLGGSRGRVLAEQICAPRAVPSFDNSAMDGYALDTRGLDGGGPWRLRVSARTFAGEGAARSIAGGAVQIFTGAPLPPEADTVVAQEEVDRRDSDIVLRCRPVAGANIRRVGSDMAAGQPILAAGARLEPCQIAAAAAIGRGELTVRRRLRVALLASGDELCAAGDDPRPTAIWDVNTPMIAALLDRPDVELLPPRRRADDPLIIAAELAGLARRADLIVTTGGVSVGEADFIRPALARIGGHLHFAGVAMKPGKPVAFGQLGRAMWLGLPGNPVAALVSWALFGGRTLARLSGAKDGHVRRRHVVASAALSHRPGRCEFRPAQLTGLDGMGRETVDFPAMTRSHRVSDVIDADGFVVLPAEVETVPQGGWVEFLPFSLGGHPL